MQDLFSHPCSIPSVYRCIIPTTPPLSQSLHHSPQLPSLQLPVQLLVSTAHLVLQVPHLLTVSHSISSAYLCGMCVFCLVQVPHGNQVHQLYPLPHKVLP